MSNMLEQAIIDAKTLREAAIKNAEEAVIQKYSEEVKSAVSKILEQEEELPLDDLGDEEEVDSTAMEQVPMAHVASENSEEDIVEVNLDDILAAAEAEDPTVADALDAELDKEEIASEVGIDIPEDTPPANRQDEEIDLNEDELVNMFKEMLVVDVPEIEVEQAAEEIEEDDFARDEEVEKAYRDGMDEKDIEAHERLHTKSENLTRENTKLKNLLRKAKDKLEEINLQNARLLYANRVLQDTSLNEQQKNKIAELVGTARSVVEAKMVYETLQKTMADTQSGGPKSLSEAVTRRSSVILSGNRNNESRSTDTDPTYNRWATLAGTKNN